MKRWVLWFVIIALIFSFTGCKSSIEKAEELAAEGRYEEAITELEGDGSAEASSLIASYSIEYARDLAGKKEYGAAVEQLRKLEQTEQISELITEYTMEQAALYAAAKDYSNALSYLYELEKSDERDSLIYEYTECYIQSLLDIGKIQEAKDYLNNLEAEKNAAEEIAKCYVLILAKLVEEEGVRGESGKRVYKTLSDGTVVYIEASDDNEIVFGQEMSNAVGGNSLKLFIDGSPNPYFEASLSISFSLLGHQIDNTASGFGTIDISNKNYPITMDSFKNSGAVNTSGTTVTDLVSEDSFKDSMKSWTKTIVQNIPGILETLDSEWTLADFGFAT